MSVEEERKKLKEELVNLLKKFPVRPSEDKITVEAWEAKHYLYIADFKHWCQKQKYNSDNFSFQDWSVLFNNWLLNKDK